MPKTRRQLDQEINEIIKSPRQKRKRLALGRQRLLFIKFQPAATFSGTRAVPIPVDFDESEVARVWTLLGETDQANPPALPFVPMHGRNAFLEDWMHDWNIITGKFHYGSRIADHDVWVLVEMKSPK